MSACLVVVWSLEFCIWMSESRAELNSCGPNMEHQVGQLIPLLFSVATKRVTISGQRVDLYKRIRCRGNMFQLAVVYQQTSLLCFSDCTFQASCHSTYIWEESWAVHSFPQSFLLNTIPSVAVLIKIFMYSKVPVIPYGSIWNSNVTNRYLRAL
jgi:hypothetical protein